MSIFKRSVILAVLSLLSFKNPVTAAAAISKISTGSAPSPSIVLRAASTLTSISPAPIASETDIKERRRIGHALQVEISQVVDQRRLKLEHGRQLHTTLENTRAVLLHILKEKHQDGSDYPYLHRHLLSTSPDEAPHTPVLIAASSAFAHAQSLDEYAHALIRFGASAINLLPKKIAPPKPLAKEAEGKGTATVVLSVGSAAAAAASAASPSAAAPPSLLSEVDAKEDTQRLEYSLLAGDCFLFAARYLDDHLSTLFKDLHYLPPHRKHAQESGYLTTTHGQRLAIDCAGSVALLYKWAAFRLSKDDPRREGMRENIKDFNRLYTHYYEAHGTTPPSIGEILQTSPLVPAFAGHIRLHGEIPVTLGGLRNILAETADMTYHGILRFCTRPTAYYMKGYPLTYQTFRHMLAVTISTHLHEYNTSTLIERRHNHSKIMAVFDELHKKAT